MELYIQIIFVLALAKFCLKAAMTGRFWTMACYAFFAALVSLALYPTVIEQPATVITNLLADRELVTDGAVLTTTEAILGIFVSVFLLSNYFKPKGQRRKSVFVLKVVPGILWIFAVAYFELLFFRQRVGADFGATVAIYAGIVFAVVLLAAGFIHLFVRHESMKLELKIMLNMGILLIGLLVNASAADSTVVYATVSNVEWGALAALTAGTACFFLLGLLSFPSQLPAIAPTALAVALFLTFGIDF